MLFLPWMRREAARQLLSEIACAIAVDVGPTRRKRSRRQHLRNGFGAILGASSQVVFRPGLVAALYYATRARVRTEFRYGIAELLLAGAPASERQRRLLLAAVPSIAMSVAFALRARTNARAFDQGVSEPIVTEPVEPVVSPEPVAAGVVE